MISKIKLNWNLRKITEKGRILLLAYDHGMEHGTSDFSGKNIDPQYVLDIAKKGSMTAIALQKGIAEKYHDSKKDVPLVMKLNGKTNLRKGEPLSKQICSVKEAKEIGATAVGYTIYLGSEFESQMMTEFSKIEEEAHKLGMPVFGWIYPRGKAVPELTPQVIEYAARVALEMGADFAKINYSGSVESFKKVVKAAGRCKVISLGGTKKEDKSLLQIARATMDSGAYGMAVGRNIWQHKSPVKMAQALRSVIFQDSTVNEAMKLLRK